MNNPLPYLRTEPALVMGLLQAILICAVAFGLDLTDAQQATILGLASAFFALAVRARVSPVE